MLRQLSIMRRLYKGKTGGEKGGEGSAGVDFLLFARATKKERKEGGRSTPLHPLSFILSGGGGKGEGRVPSLLFSLPLIGEGRALLPYGRRGGGGDRRFTLLPFTLLEEGGGKKK